MQSKTLNFQWHTDADTGCLCRYVRSDTERFRPHSHSFYEIFLMVKGRAMHLINGKEHPLKEGELLFIRDFDEHDYRAVNGGDFEFINLAFTKETLESLSGFLGDAFPIKDLLSAQAPPLATLSERETKRLFFALTDIPQAGNKDLIKLRFRVLISDIFVSYFLNFTEKNSDIPLWLEIAVEKMKKPLNFTQGVSKMYQLAGKSREHVSRSLMQYYDVSPTAFVNDLRLDYSAKLLVTSNLSVTDVGFECGFENISWFYKAFEKKFGTTPLKYRKENT